MIETKDIQLKWKFPDGSSIIAHSLKHYDPPDFLKEGRELECVTNSQYKLQFDLQLYT